MRKITTSFNTNIKECKDNKKCGKCDNIILVENDLCNKCLKMVESKNGD